MPVGHNQVHLLVRLPNSQSTVTQLLTVFVFEESTVFDFSTIAKIAHLYYYGQRVRSSPLFIDRRGDVSMGIGMCAAATIRVNNLHIPAPLKERGQGGDGFA